MGVSVLEAVAIVVGDAVRISVGAIVGAVVLVVSVVVVIGDKVGVGSKLSWQLTDAELLAVSKTFAS